MLQTALTNFLRDEGGAVTVDSVAVLGGSAWMAVALVGDVAAATLDLSEDISNRLEYASVLAEILDDYGPGSGIGSPFCEANPGNDKCVGNAGENPNGQGGWGGGSYGASDGDGSPGNSGNNGGGNGNGNNGGGNGNNG